MIVTFNRVVFMYLSDLKEVRHVVECSELATYTSPGWPVRALWLSVSVIGMFGFRKGLWILPHEHLV